MAQADAGGLPVPRTPEGRAGLEAILSEPGTALIAMDFDGTLSPIVADPREARAHPGAVAGLRGLAGLVGTLAVITGRPAGEAVELGGFGRIPGLIVLGHYGWERWEDGTLAAPPPPPGVATARARLPELLAEAGAPEGTRIEDKGSALAVHTRRTDDPAAALAAVADPLADLAAATGLTLEPGRLVIELRPPGMDKGSALAALAAERKSGAILFAGDDLGDLPAFGAVRALRAAGHPGLTVCSASGEVSELAAEADLVVAGPDEVAALLRALARSLAASPRPAR
ncbi:MAG TPA: trehalose-phosphatase [Streptosporangiaceae bacterium]|nr:trehalose-phosphatase [Streptosporangiaceae bacterium]